MRGAPTRRFCVRCTGIDRAHYLTCPVLLLPQDVPLFSDAAVSSLSDTEEL